MANKSFNIQEVAQQHRRILLAELGGKANITSLQDKVINHTAYLMARADELAHRHLDSTSNFYALSSLHHQVERQFRMLGLFNSEQPLRGGKRPQPETLPKTIRDYARGNGKGAAA